MPLSQASQPLYHRVSREIAREIESGTLQPADGLIEGRGRGSLVRGGALAEPPNTLMSLSELGRSRGLDATARVLSAAVRAATIDEAEAFAIAPGADVFELERVRMLDGVPISIDHHRLAVRGARARRQSAAARGLRARGPRRGRAGGRAAVTRAGCARPAHENG